VFLKWFSAYKKIVLADFCSRRMKIKFAISNIFFTGVAKRQHIFIPENEVKNSAENLKNRFKANLPEVLSIQKFGFQIKRKKKSSVFFILLHL